MFSCEMEMFRNQFEIVCAPTEWVNESRMDSCSLLLAVCAKRVCLEGVKESYRCSAA